MMYFYYLKVKDVSVNNWLWYPTTVKKNDLKTNILKAKKNLYTRETSSYSHPATVTSYRLIHLGIQRGISAT